MYINSGQWVYRTPDTIGKDGKYISPRTWSKLNSAELAGAASGPEKQQMHRIVCQSILGKHIGNEYWKTCWDDAPVLASDLLTDYDKALAKLKKQSQKGDSYGGDKIAVTVESIIENYGGWYDGIRDSDGNELDRDHEKVDEATMVAVATTIPSDQAVNLIKGCGYKVHKGKITSFFKEFQKRNKQCIDIMKSNIKVQRALKNK
jgi:hypothetical protein